MSIQNLSYTTLSFLSATPTIDTYGTSVLNYTKVFESNGRINYKGGYETLLNGKISTIPTNMIYVEPLLPINTAWQIIENSSGDKYDILHINQSPDYSTNHHLQIYVKKVNDYNLN